MDDRKHSAAEREFGTARRLHQQGRLAEAEKLYRAAIDIDAEHFEAKEWLGVLCFQRGGLTEAIGLLSEASALCPDKPEYHSNLAAALLQANRPDEAVAAFERCLAAAPAAIEPRTKLGDLLLRLGRPRRAMDFYRQAVELDPHLRAVCRDTAQFPSGEASANAVVENCRHILARHPNYAEAHYGKACALLTLGRETDARRSCERALVLNPTIPVYYHVLIHTGDPHSNANAVSALEQLATAEDELTADERVTLHFLLAKAYEDSGRKEDAFAHLVKANAAKRAMIAYDEAHELGRMRDIAATFSPTLLATPSEGCNSDLPVFVVGMPRSGTTLVEQILASHPEVFGAGELTTLPDLIKEHFGLDLPAAITPDALRDLGEAYVARTRALAPNAKRIVDKLPYNFQNVGLIARALPKAHIIHIRRDALDTCFSCFALSFAGEVGFAYDMGELGRYYRAYDTLMSHWRTTRPCGAMLEVRYEDLVANLENETRRMIAYCGLEWDSRCLDFHKSDRAVVTASLHQVRQPLYKTSVGRATAFAEQLALLRQTLGRD